MPKALSLAGMVVAVLLFLVFTADLITGIPFAKASPLMDIGFMICSALLLVMAWLTRSEQT